MKLPKAKNLKKESLVLTLVLLFLFINLQGINAAAGILNKGTASYSNSQEVCISTNVISLSGTAQFSLDKEKGIIGDGFIEGISSEDSRYYKTINSLKCSGFSCEKKLERSFLGTCVAQINGDYKWVAGTGSKETISSENWNVQEQIQTKAPEALSINRMAELLDFPVEEFLIPFCVLPATRYSGDGYTDLSFKDDYGRLKSLEIRFAETPSTQPKTGRACSKKLEYYYPIDEDWDDFANEPNTFFALDCFDVIGTAIDKDSQCSNIIDFRKNNLENWNNALPPCDYDKDNDGIGDYSGCGFCTFPGFSSEIVDNVDNNCIGTCQGDISVKCKVAGNFYSASNGDGGESQDCSGVKNFKNVEDSFCQIVDEFEITIDASSTEEEKNYLKQRAKSEGYFRRVLGGYLILNDASLGDKIQQESYTIVGAQETFIQKPLRGGDSTIPVYERKLCGSKLAYAKKYEAYFYFPGGYNGMATLYNSAIFDKVLNFNSITEGPSSVSFPAMCGKYEIIEITGLDENVGKVYLVPEADWQFSLISEYAFEAQKEELTSMEKLDGVYPVITVGSKFIRPVKDQTCLANKESLGKTRNTPGIEENFIDSMFGELNYLKFIEIMKANGLSNATGNFNSRFSFGMMGKGRINEDITTKTAALAYKDKCDDKTDNDGIEDIHKAIPYKWFLTLYETFFYATPEKEGSAEIRNSFEVYLADVDDPDCKFSSEITSDTPLIIETSKLRVNPVSGETYCLDADKDGFCGCIQEIDESKTSCSSSSACQSDEVCKEGKCVKCLKSRLGQEGINANSYGIGSPTTESLAERCYIWEDPSPCNSYKTLDKYSFSPSFPDCDDDSSDDNAQYQYYLNQVSGEIQPIAPTSLTNWKLKIPKTGTGWSLDFRNKDIGAWYVHPFAPIKQGACSYNKWDFNCNKDYNAGYAFKNLFLAPDSYYADYYGDPNANTPFDYSMGTGAEIETSGLTGLGALTSGRDLICHKNNAILDGLAKQWPILVIDGAAVISGAGVLVVISNYVNLLQGSYGVAGVMQRINAGEMSWGEAVPLLAGSTLQIAGSLGSTYAQMKSLGVNQMGKANVKADDKGLHPQTGNPQKGTSNQAAKASRTQPENPITKVEGCFLNETYVLMADGTTKNIADIKIGEEVVAFDLETNQAVNATITYTFAREETKYRIIIYEEIKD